MPRPFGAVGMSGEPAAVLPTAAAPSTNRIRRRSRQRGGRRPIRRVVIVAVAVLAVVLAAGVGWLGVRVQPVRSHLEQAAALIWVLERQVQASDLVGGRATLAELQRHTSAARSDSSGFDWSLGSGAPVVGADFGAVRTVSAVLDDLSHQVFPVIVDVAGSVRLSSLLPHSGQLDLSGLQQAAPRLAAMDAAVVRAADQVDAIPTEDLLPALRTAVGTLADGLDRVRSLTSTAAKAAVLLPSMLGANGPRTYLVLFQNPAEIRATGGMPGTFLVIRADRGRLQIINQGTASGDIRSFDAPVLPLDPEMKALYTDRLGAFPADINATPHFPTVALLAREMYRRRSGTTVDGVLAADPIALSYLLNATGPLAIPNGPALSADTAVRTLLSDAYARPDRAVDKDWYFAAAARVVFEALSGGAARPDAALAALARAAGERRLLVWSSDPADRAALAGTVLDGSLPTKDGDNPIVGLFLNDGSGAKLGYYLTHDAHLAVTACRADGRRELSLRATLGSTAPSSGLAADVLGLGLAGDPYTVRTHVMAFSPAGGSVMDVRLDGAPVSFGSGTERKRMVGIVTLDLKPGQSKTLEFRLLTVPLAGHDSVRPALWVTPGVNRWGLEVAPTANCP